MTLKLNGSTSGSVSIDAPASTTGGADVTFKLPVADGTSGQVLTTNASGQLQFAAPGTILQVQNTTYTDVAQISIGSAYTWHKISQIAVTITPTAASSKFLISGIFGGEMNQDDHGIYWKLIRTVDGSDTDIGIGDADGNRTRCTQMMQTGYHSADNDSTTTHSTIPNYLDSPNTTDAITYNVGITTEGASKSWLINRTWGTTDAAAYERVASWLTVMEVAG